MPGGRRFPLDGAFAELRAEVEGVQAAFASFKAALGGGGSAAGAAASAGAPLTDAIKKLNREQKELSGTGARLNRVLQDTRKEMSYLERGSETLRDKVSKLGFAFGSLAGAAAGVGGIAQALGFEALSAHAAAAAGALAGMQSAIVGLGAAAPLLAQLAAPLVIASAGAVAFQAAIKSATGETLSLTDVVAATSVAVAAGLSSLASRAQSVFVGLKDTVAQAFYGIQATIQSAIANAFSSVSKTLTAAGQAILQLPEGVLASIPGVRELGQSLTALGGAAEVGAAQARANLAAIGDAAAASAAQARAAGQAIAESAAASAEGFNTQINKIFNRQAAGQKSALEDPLGAARQFGQDFVKILKDAGLVGGEAAGSNMGKGIKGVLDKAGLEAGDVAKGVKNALSSPAVQQAAYSSGSGGGGSWSSGFADSLQNSESQIDEAIVNELIMDPEKEGKVVSSFRKFLKNLKNLFRQNPLGFTLGLFGASVTGGGLNVKPADATGFAKGGAVPWSTGLPSLAHLLGGQGFARGGRPRGLAASDTVPAWLTPGEFVQPLSAVHRYGVRFMEQLRQGLVDPGAVEALSARLSPPAAGSPPSLGFATGGAVGAGGSRQDGRAVMAAVVATPSSLQALLHGGGSALAEHMRDNSATYRLALGL